jgi:hypothetical protein
MDDQTPKPALIVEGLTWAQLNQKHDCYDSLRVNKLNLLLKGGYDITKKDNAKKFMPRWRSESGPAYMDRVSFAAYENNFGEIINDLSSTLFSKPVAVLQATDADDPNTMGDEPDPNAPDQIWQHKFTLKGDTMADFMREIQNESNAVSRAYFGVDFLGDGEMPYAYHIDPCSVLDWQCDDEGNFIFIVMRNDDSSRVSVRQLRDSITTTFLVWTKAKEKVKLDTYQITYPKNQLPNDNDVVHKMKSPEQPLTFKDIPIVCCETPDSISVGQLIGQLAGSLFARYTTYLFCLNRGVNPILAYKQGYDLPAKGDLSIINEDEERGEAALDANVSGKRVIGPTDELEWVEIKGDALKIVQEQMAKDKNEMYRLVNSLNSIISSGDVSTAQTKASGVAKMIDNAAKEHMLEAYAKLVKQWIVKAFNIAFRALEQDVVWQCKGMDYYRVVDEEALQARIAALPTYKTNIPSKTSYKQVLIDTAYELHPFTNIGTLNKIQEEINDNIDAMDFGDLHTSINPQGAVEADSAKQLDKAVPQKPGQGATQSSSNNVSGPAREVGSNGQAAQPDGNHLQTGEHIDPQIVYDLLSGDYKEKDIQFVMAIPWIGPVEVPLTSIDFSNMTNWEAYGRDDKIAEFKDKFKEGFDKPIILVNEMNTDGKMVILDGHTRALAYMESGQPANAYIGQVGRVTKEMKQMHDLQKSGEKGGSRTEKKPEDQS